MWLPLIGLAAVLAGCSVSLTGPIPGAHGKTGTYHVTTTSFSVPARPLGPHGVLAPATPPAASAATPGTIDLESVAATLVRMPRILGSLTFDLYLCTALIAGVGLVNIAYVSRLPKLLRAAEAPRTPRAYPAISPRTVATPPKAGPVTERARQTEVRLSVRRLCECGAVIASRSQSGRCRRCAQIARLAKVRAALPKAAPPAIEHASIASARVGERRRYYVFEPLGGGESSFAESALAR